MYCRCTYLKQASQEPSDGTGRCRKIRGGKVSYSVEIWNYTHCSLQVEDNSSIFHKKIDRRQTLIVAKLPFRWLPHVGISRTLFRAFRVEAFTWTVFFEGLLKQLPELCAMKSIDSSVGILPSVEALYRVGKVRKAVTVVFGLCWYIRTSRHTVDKNKKEPASLRISRNGGQFWLIILQFNVWFIPCTVLSGDSYLLWFSE